MSDSPPPPLGGAPPPGQYPPTGPSPAYGQAPPAGPYPPPADPPPTQAGWGAGGGVPPPYGSPPPSGGGAGKVVLIVLGVVLGLAALVVVAAIAVVVIARSDNDAETVVRTTISLPVPDFDSGSTPTTTGAEPGDSVLNPDGGTASGGRSIDVFDLAVGDCFDVDASGDISSVTGLDCDEPHDNEVYAIFAIAGGPSAPFPGDAAVRTQAEARCSGALFTDYVGVPFTRSRFDATSINPTRQTWESELADREVICVAKGPGGERLTASVRGADE